MPSRPQLTSVKAVTATASSAPPRASSTFRAAGGATGGNGGTGAASARPRPPGPEARSPASNSWRVASSPVRRASSRHSSASISSTRCGTGPVSGSAHRGQTAPGAPGASGREQPGQ